MITSIEQSFTASLYRPYLDLGPFHGGPLHVWGIEFDYRSLTEGKQYPRIQSVMAPSFREVLVRETGLLEYGLQDPLELPRAIQTERWQQLCDYLIRFSQLTQLEQMQVARLLGKLCLYQAVLQYVPEMTSEDITSGEIPAQLAYARAQARYVLSADGTGQPYSLAEFEILATHAPRGGLARINALYQMVVQNVKDAYRLSEVEHWLPLHLKEIQIAKSELDEYTYKLLMSRYHRVGGFLPQMRRDKEGTVHEMELAQHYAESMPQNDESQCIGRLEMIYPVLESRTKEALWLGDLQLAEERARRLVEIAPCESRARLHLGEVLLERNKVEEAAEIYRSAVCYGPPGTEIAWFMAGQCYEDLGRLDEALGAYLAAFRLDPQGISTAERIAALAYQTGNKLLERWCAPVLSDLQQAKDQIRPLAAYQNIPPPVAASRQV
jgi:tetratricopeptide (TPR) repeat protein